MTSNSAKTDVHHIHLHVKNVSEYKTIFEEVFGAQLFDHVIVGSKEILKFELNGIRIFLSPAKGEFDEINHIGMMTDNIEQQEKLLKDKGFEVVEKGITDKENIVFLKSTGGLTLEFLQSLS